VARERHQLTSHPSQYDTIGGVYDLVGGLDIYHRLFWGVSTRDYRAFADAAMAASGSGALLDAGCGSMLFTAHAHRAHESTIGSDASIRMLGLARSRLGSSAEPRHVPLVHADMLGSPFRSCAFNVVLCMHMAHVVDDLNGLLGETERILKRGGKLFLTSVVLVDGWRDHYLRMLFRRGIMASPRRVHDVLAAVRTHFGSEPAVTVKGSMLFVEAAKP
jgi:ubiquinone/menaquinone biosynthesis C-methylase UbiE